MLDRILSVFVAVGLALLLWLYARSRDQEILDNVPIPVQLTLSGNQGEQYLLETHGDSRVMVTFTGSPIRIRELRDVLQRGELHVNLAYTVPEDRLEEGRYADTLLVEAADVHAPPGITVMMAEGRNRIPITVQRLVERRLPVRLDTGRDDGSAPGRVTIEPATVLVRGPQEVLDRAKFISTQPAALSTHSGGGQPWATTISKVAMLEELENRPVRVVPDRVTVRTQARQLYELHDVPINFLCPPGFLLRPQFLDSHSGRVNLKVWGPIQDDPPHVYAFVDLTREGLTSGLNHETLQFQMPKDCSQDKEPGRIVAFELLPADFIPRDTAP